MGSPPPPDAAPLDVQQAAGIGVPPPPNAAPPGGSGGAGASFGIGAGLSPPDAPSTDSQATASASANFAVAPIPLFCGFAIPGFNFSIELSLQLPPFPPDFLLLFGLSFNCNLSDPISASVAVGGGRLPPPVQPDLDADFLVAA